MNDFRKLMLIILVITFTTISVAIKVLNKKKINNDLYIKLENKKFFVQNIYK